MNRLYVFLSALAIVAIIGGSYVLGQSYSKPQEVKAAAATTGQTQQPAASNNPRPAGDGGGAPPPAVPQPTSAPQAKSGQCMDWNTFVAQTQGITDPYKLIDWLDLRPEKVDHPQAGFTLTPGIYILWTGLYVSDTSLGGTTTSFRVDGKTGVWIVNTSQNLTVPTAGGTICITGFGGAVSPSPVVSPAASSCVDTAQVISIINSNKTSNPNQIYVLLDQMVDQNPSARMRNGVAASYSIDNSKALFWVRTGQINGSVLELDRTESKSLYLATASGTVSVTFAHSGVRLCSDLNPQRDFPWWGKN